MGISDEDNKDKDINDVDVEIVNMSTDDNSQDNHDSSDSGGAGDDMSPAPSGHRGRVSRSDIIRYVIMGVALCVFIYAAVSICNRLNEYKKARDIYDDAANKVFNTTSASSDDASASESNSGSQSGYKYLDINFEELHNLSREAIGWIDLPSCGISYPIVQHSDNDYYLNHTFDDPDDESTTLSGSIFLDYRNSPVFADEHFYIYGHRMYDNSMFGNLLKYDDEEFYKKNAAEDNNAFYIYTDDCIRKYEIFCVTDASSETQIKAFYFSSDDFTNQDYVDFVKSIELYDTGITADGDDQIATLFTCQETSKNPVRHLVHGKLVETIQK